MDISSDVFFCQAEDGIRDLVRSRGLGDVYKRQGKAIMLANEIQKYTDDYSNVHDAILHEVERSTHLLSLIHI